MMTNDNNTTEKKKISLDDLSPKTIDRIYTVLQEAKEELLQKYNLKQLVVYGDDDVAFIYDLNLHCFKKISQNFKDYKE